MRHGIYLAAVLLGLSTHSAWASDAYLSMAYTNALGDDLPFSIFSKGHWSPESHARFVKVHLYFDEPLQATGLEIDSCGAKMTAQISVFFNFDQWRLHMGGDVDQGSALPSALEMHQRGSTLVLQRLKHPIEVRSLTINFEHNSGFTLCSIRVLDKDGQPYQIHTPTLVEGSVSATSVLEPRAAYDPINLFDSRFEYGWAANKQAKDVALNFTFAHAQKIARLRIWNGYQRSITHCQANSRAKILRLSGDGGYKSEVPIADVLGSQVVSLPQPFSGLQLKIEVVDAYLGKAYPDLVISELRFSDGKDWFMLDPTSQLKDVIASNIESFRKTKTESLLNDSYVATQSFEKSPLYITSTLRLRSDGSFYLAGDLGEAGDEQYFALGSYEVRSVDAAGGITLRLFGLYYETEVYGDCNGCGRDCNRNASEDEGPIERIFQIVVTIREMPGGQFRLVKKSGSEAIKFKELLLAREGA